jgi:hypothetical protein
MQGILFALLLSMSHSAIASDVQMQSPSITQQGQLFSLKYTPGTRKLVISVAGKQAAQLQPLAVLKTKGSAQDLTLEPAPEGFKVREKLPADAFAVEVIEAQSKKKETFRFARP